MAFRRDSASALQWKKWRQGHDELRVAAGLSSEVMETVEEWWEYLNHEINVPGYDYNHSFPLTPQQAALNQLVIDWPGGIETALGQAFVSLEQRNIILDAELQG